MTQKQSGQIFIRPLARSALRHFAIPTWTHARDSSGASAHVEGFFVFFGAFLFLAIAAFSKVENAARVGRRVKLKSRRTALAMCDHIVHLDLIRNLK